MVNNHRDCKSLKDQVGPNGLNALQKGVNYQLQYLLYNWDDPPSTVVPGRKIPCHTVPGQAFRTVMALQKKLRSPLRCEGLPLLPQPMDSGIKLPSRERS